MFEWFSILNSKSSILSPILWKHLLYCDWKFHLHQIFIKKKLTIQKMPLCKFSTSTYWCILERKPRITVKCHRFSEKAGDNENSAPNTAPWSLRSGGRPSRRGHMVSPHIILVTLRKLSKKKKKKETISQLHRVAMRLK